MKTNFSESCPLFPIITPFIKELLRRNVLNFLHAILLFLFLCVKSKLEELRGHKAVPIRVVQRIQLFSLGDTRPLDSRAKKIFFFYKHAIKKSWLIGHWTHINID